MLSRCFECGDFVWFNMERHSRNCRASYTKFSKIILSNNLVTNKVNARLNTFKYEDSDPYAYVEFDNCPIDTEYANKILEDVPLVELTSNDCPTFDNTSSYCGNVSSYTPSMDSTNSYDCNTTSSNVE